MISVGLALVHAIPSDIGRRSEDMRTLLLVFSFALASYAGDSRKETRNFGVYSLAAERPCNDFNQYEKCWPNTLPATIFDAGKSEIATIPNVYYGHYHPFEVHGKEIFWIARVGDISTKDWLDQLWVRGLTAGPAEKLLEHRGLDFRASTDGKKVVFTENNTISVLDRKSNSTKVLGHDEGTEGGLTMLAWSDDGSKFWFGAGDAEAWSKLAVFQDGKVTWFPFKEGSSDEAFEPNQGWQVTSNAPFIDDVDDEEEFKKSGMMTKLEVVDVFTGERAVLAEAKANHYNPFWNPEGLLQYSVGNKTFKISKKQIAGKLR